MSLLLYMDHHVRAEITEGVRRKNIDVLTAVSDGRHTAGDSILLQRATELHRVLFSQDRDLLVHAAQWQRMGRRFAGLLYAHQLGITIAQCIADLELICNACEAEEMENRVMYLPL